MEADYPICNLSSDDFSVNLVQDGNHIDDGNDDYQINYVINPDSIYSVGDNAVICEAGGLLKDYRNKIAYYTLNCSNSYCYEFLKKIGIEEPSSSFQSSKRFEDGGQFRFEVPGIQSPKTMEALLDESIKQNIFIHRVTQTKGIMLLTDEEINHMVSMAKDYGCELFLSVK